jgi:putative SOS response-associated peptidase YedK
MPVLLAPDEEAAWLAGEGEDPASLLDPYDGDDLRAYPVSRAVNDPGNDSPEIIEPVEVDEQSGPGEFGA